MASDSTFDVVSKVDRQEVDNALNQAAKEVSQRYDFKGTGASVAWSGDDAIVITANSEDRVLAVLNVLQTKLIRRGVSLKVLDTGEPRASGKEYRLESSLKEGLGQEDAKKIGKLARPKRIVWSDDLPKTRSGKIMRRLLRDIAEGRELGDVTTLRDPDVMKQLQGKIAEKGDED